MRKRGVGSESRGREEEEGQPWRRLAGGGQQRSLAAAGWRGKGREANLGWIPCCKVILNSLGLTLEG
jgi:hypothetical protein